MHKDGDNSSMTSPTAMTREELLELAALDAFGLLDAFETDRYTRSFHDAPAAVQDEIIRIQAELASDVRLMTADEPPTSLRQRVLDAVAAAIERETSQLAPIATIGRRGGRIDAHGRVTLAASGQFWRAAAFALAGMVIVIAYFFSQTNQSKQQVIDLAANRLTDSQIKAMIGTDFEFFVKNPNVVARVLRPYADDYPGQATVYINTKSNEALVVGFGIPELGEQGTPDEPYTLAVNHADGTTETLHTFRSNGLVSAILLKIDSTKFLSSTWKISGPRGVVLQSA